MNAKIVKNNAVKSFLTISKIEILLFCVLLGLIVILSYFKLINPVLGFFALFAFINSIHLFVFQKRVSAQAILMSISGVLFLVDSFLFVYRDTLSFPMKAYLYQISGGIMSMATGLMVIAFAVAMLSISRSDPYSRSEYSQYITFMWLWFILCGIVVIGIGIFSLVLGLQYL